MSCVLGGALSAHAEALVAIPEGATAADVQQAIDTVDDGGTVRFGAGTWTLDATLVLSRSVTVEGSGASATTLDFNNACRGFNLSHADATVANLKIYRGKVTNDAGGGVYMTKGTVRNCHIADCLAHAATGSANRGGGISVSGGLVEGCEISGCKCDNLYGLGNAVYQTGGTVRGCDIHGNNKGYSHSTVAYGSGVVYLSGGVFENSKVHGNDKESNAGIYLNNGTVRNCLVYGNTGKYGSSGIYMDNGTVLFCTVYGNTMTGDTTGRSGLCTKYGTVKNSIFWANGTPGGFELRSGGTATVANNIFDVSIEGNLTGDPLFNDAANGDLTISSVSSSAYGTAEPVATVTTDIVGVPRDETAPACGAYEISLPVATPTFAPESGATFSSSLDVTLACATPGATIRYTTDGSDPTESSAAYAGPIVVSGQTTTVKARAYAEYMKPSDIASAAYVYEGASIIVSSTSDEYGTVTPVYGEDVAPEVGREYVFTCATDIVEVVPDATRAVCLGWTLFDGETVLKSSTDAGEGRFSCRHTYQAGQRLTLQWQWQVEHAVTASAPAAMGSVAGGGWIVDGEPVTLTATAASEAWAFVRWTGNVPSGFAETNPLEIAAVTGPMTLAAVFVGDVTLSPEQADMLGELVGALPTGSRVTLEEGTYSLASTLVLSNDVIVAGAGADKTVLDFQKVCRGVEMTAAGAVLEGVTIVHAKVTGHGGGVNMTAGKVRSCRITGCTASSYYSSGGGVYLTGGTVEGCEIDNCIFDNLYGHGNAIAMTGGLVTGCDIHDNNGGYTHSGGYGDAVVQVKGGTLAASRIHDNTKSATAGIRQEGGTVVNCLLYGNRASSFGSAGIYKTNGNTYNCTIYDCVMTGDTTGTSGLNQLNGTTKNCIVWGSAPEGSTAGSVKIAGGTFQNNVSEVAVTTSTQTGDPVFVNAATNDFRITRASSAYQTGLVLADVTTDLAGVERDTTHPCVGVYEYDPSTEVFEVNLRFDRGQYPAGAAVVVEAIVSGVGEAVLPVVWTVDGAALSETAATVTLENLAPGAHTVIATVAFEGAEATKEGTVTLLPLKVYVNRTGSAVYPYATEETGTCSIPDAVAALYSASDVTNEVEIAAGEYTNETIVAFVNPVRMYGVGRDETKVICATRIPAFRVDNAASTISDLTVSNAAHGVILVSGAVRNCRFEDCWCATEAYAVGGAGVSMSGGMVADCLFERCGSSYLYGGGGGVMISGGVVSNCVFRQCWSRNGNASRGGGALYMDGSLAKALVTHCRIEESTGTVYPAFHIRGGQAVLRNTFVSGTTAGTTDMTYSQSARIESCTIAHNRVGAGCHAVVADWGSLVNTIIWDNPGGVATNVIYAARYSCYPSAAHGVDGNTTNAPLVRADGRLRASSPCRDAGESQAWMTDAFDLNGNPRIIGGAVDMGAFETPKSGITLIVR